MDMSARLYLAGLGYMGPAVGWCRRQSTVEKSEGVGMFWLSRPSTWSITSDIRLQWLLQRKGGSIAQLRKPVFLQEPRETCDIHKRRSIQRCQLPRRHHHKRFQADSLSFLASRLSFSWGSRQGHSQAVLVSDQGRCTV